MEEISMGKKHDQFRRLVQDMGDRYGMEDVDVLCLKQELNEREIVGEPKLEERRKVQTCRYTFGSIAKKNFDESRQAAPH